MTGTGIFGFRCDESDSSFFAIAALLFPYPGVSGAGRIARTDFPKLCIASR